MHLQYLIDQYLAGIDTLQRAVVGLSVEQQRARPIPGKWSTLEVVCHLADFDLIDADRIKRTLAEDRPVIFDIDERQLAAALGYQQRVMQEELAVIEATRRQLARILSSRTDAILARECVYRTKDRVETQTLEWHLVKAVEHIPHHVSFIREKRRALGLPI